MSHSRATPAISVRRSRSNAPAAICRRASLPKCIGNYSSDFGLHGIDLVARFHRAGVIHSSEYGGACGRPKYANGIGGPVLSSARLVADTPGRRNSCPQPLSSDLVVNEPGFDAVA